MSRRKSWLRRGRMASGYLGLFSIAAGMFYLTMHLMQPNWSWPNGTTPMAYPTAILFIIGGLSVYLGSVSRLDDRVQELEDKMKHK